MKINSIGSMTLRYMIALGILATLSCVSYFILQKNIKAQQTSAAVVNLSGRQRMLSQRIALKAHQLVKSNDAVAKEKIRQELHAAIDSMEHSHYGLIYGSSEMNLPGRPSQKVSNLFFRPPFQLDTKVRDYIKVAKIIADTPDSELTQVDPSIFYILDKSNEVLIVIDKLVRQYQEESETAIRNLQLLEKIILISVLFVLGVVALFIFRPMVKRIKLETSELERAEKYFRTITEMAADGIIIINEHGVVESFNRAAEQIFGYSLSQVMGRNVNMLMSEPYRSDHDSYINNYLEKASSVKGPIFGREITGLRKDGSTVPLALTVSEIKLENRRLFISSVRDITERKNMEEQLKAIAITDELTELFNRRGFCTVSEKQWNLAKRNRRKMALLFTDLDNMKTINDTLGHKTGDQALIDAANILRKSFRESDIIARIGGDEFVVLLTEHSELDIENIIYNSVKNNVRILNDQNNRKYQLSLSMGIAHFDPERPCSIKELLIQADALMYKNKKKLRTNQQEITETSN